MALDSATLQEYMAIAKKAALAGGKAILEIYHSNAWDVRAKKDETPLTAADEAAHTVIMQHLAATELPVLSEEGSNIPYETRKAWPYFWMVDPLDGTKEFIKKNGEFTVNIALIHEHKAIAGVLYAPVLNVLYYADPYTGAWKIENGKESQLKIKADAAVKTVVASRSHLSEETSEFIAQYKGVNTLSMGSSLKFMLLAEGKAQIYPRFAPTMEWDTAAAQAILENAGGMVLKYPEMTALQYNREDMLNPWFIAK